MGSTPSAGRYADTLLLPCLACATTTPKCPHGKIVDLANAILKRRVNDPGRPLVCTIGRPHDGCVSLARRDTTGLRERFGAQPPIATDCRFALLNDVGQLMSKQAPTL